MGSCARRAQGGNSIDSGSITRGRGLLPFLQTGRDARAWALLQRQTSEGGLAIWSRRRRPLRAATDGLRSSAMRRKNRLARTKPRAQRVRSRAIRIRPFRAVDRIGRSSPLVGQPGATHRPALRPRFRSSPPVFSPHSAGTQPVRRRAERAPSSRPDRQPSLRGLPLQ